MCTTDAELLIMPALKTKSLASRAPSCTVTRNWPSCRCPTKCGPHPGFRGPQLDCPHVRQTLQAINGIVEAAPCSTYTEAATQFSGGRSPNQTRTTQHGDGASLQVIKDMVELVLCSTDAEAANLGIFLQHTLSLMARWRVRAL